MRGDQKLFIFAVTLLVTLVLLTLLCVFISKKLLKKLTRRSKQWWLIIHALSVIIYFGGIFGQLLVTSSMAFFSDQSQIYVGILFISYFDHYLTIPGALASLFTGIWLALRTQWGGLTKYYWVLTKWIGNMLAILLGSSITGNVVYNLFPKILSSDLHPLQNPLYFQSRRMLFWGISISFILLAFLVIISYIKPWGKRKVN
ncbi:DUF2269 domain-containing protein [Priestia megaterium]|uniref:DUF2269 domain-containing protein n=1 Tax=Priestia megaterium TaxID=1404 RepID=UPI0010CD663B|nr:DUF2269 domain-containing protein [Priestia megaterium]QCR30538.1 DUF2269 domain-containing protein [Priestia megaterium]